MFRLPDTLRPTAIGLDQLRLPAWFLRLGASVLAGHLHSSSLLRLLCLQYHVSGKLQLSVQSRKLLFQDTCRLPVSLHHTTRLLERIVRDFIYRALLSLPAALDVNDQYAFRPNGSTTAALVSILHNSHQPSGDRSIRDRHIALDFNKAFDSVRHCTLKEKYAALDIPDNIWLVELFCKYSTVQDPVTSHQQFRKSRPASIVQGSAIGSESYVVNAADLAAVTPGNKLWNYAYWWKMSEVAPDCGLRQLDVPIIIHNVSIHLRKERTYQPAKLCVQRTQSV